MLGDSGIDRVAFRVPPGGLQGWVQPDAIPKPSAYLPERQVVEVVLRRGDWAKVKYAPGCFTWVDGRRLGAPDHQCSSRPLPSIHGSKVLGTLLELVGLERYRRGRMAIGVLAFDPAGAERRAWDWARANGLHRGKTGIAGRRYVYTGYHVVAGPDAAEEAVRWLGEMYAGAIDKDPNFVVEIVNGKFGV